MVLVYLLLMHLGEWLEVEVYRDGKRYFNSYERGNPKNLIGVTEDYNGDLKGTIITI